MSGPDSAYKFTDKILSELQELEAEYPDIAVQALDTAISPRSGGNATALKFGEAHKASLVIWGWYAPMKERVYTNIHFVLLRGSENPMVPQVSPNQMYPAAALDSFAVQMDVAQHVQRVALASIAGARYAKGDGRSALRILNSVVDSGQTNERGERDHVIWLYLRGTLRFQLADTTAGLTDLNKVIDLDPGGVPKMSLWLPSHCLPQARP